MPSTFIHGVHDQAGAYLMGSRPGWITITEAIGCDPYDTVGRDYRNLKSQGFQVIVRMNNGYRPAGTIPHPYAYDDFAVRCANFINTSEGIDVAIIGNEPNHENERPDGEFITPIQYAKCFNSCYEQIKNLNSHVKICVAAVAPWDATTKYPGNSNGDWIVYYKDMLNSIFRADAICLHTYTHGTDPSLIRNEERMDPPFNNRHYNFRAYQDFLYNTPEAFQDLPVYITETDQVVPWLDSNSGWVKSAYDEIDEWNHGSDSDNHQQIHCLCLYRSNKDDQWSFTDKVGVQQDFRDAVNLGYKMEDSIMPPTPTPPTPRRWDERLNQRGVEITPSNATTGQWEWAVIEGKWFNEQEAQGRVNTFITVLDENDQLITGIPVKWFWGSGSPHESDVKKTERKNDPWLGHPYSLDFGMSSVAPSYGFIVLDGTPSDKIWGLGLGDLNNPYMKIHTAYSFTLKKRRVIVPAPIPEPPTPEPPVPTPPENLVLYHPLEGSIITQHFYQNPAYYARFNMPGHNGTDLGGKPAKTSVRALADGIIAYSAFDQNYGFYVRIQHSLGREIFSSMYCHLFEMGLSAGIRVKAGDTIGLLGSTGNSTATHLHLEIRLQNGDGQYKVGTPMPKGRVDPETFCAERGLDL